MEQKRTSREAETTPHAISFTTFMKDLPKTVSYLNYTICLLFVSCCNGPICTSFLSQHAIVFKLDLRFAEMQ